jgi:DNA replication protein DnaC
MTRADTTSAYECLKADLGYLQLGRAAECFATLADQAKAEDWSHVEYLARVIAEQAAATTNRRLAARLRYARFPYRRTIDEFDFDFQPSVDRKLVADLATLRFISEGRSIAFLGQPGCGKTHCETRIHRSGRERGQGRNR